MDAFMTAARTAMRWPAPAQVLACLPPRPQLKCLPGPSFSREQLKANIAKVRAALAGVGLQTRGR